MEEGKIHSITYGKIKVIFKYSKEDEKKICFTLIDEDNGAAISVDNSSITKLKITPMDEYVIHRDGEIYHCIYTKDKSQCILSTVEYSDGIAIHLMKNSMERREELVDEIYGNDAQFICGVAELYNEEDGDTGIHSIICCRSPKDQNMYLIYKSQKILG